MTSHDFWPKVIDKVKDELELYSKKNIWPTLRKMFYNLVSQQVIPNTRSMYNGLSDKTARNRESRDKDSLPINCFQDDFVVINNNDKYKSPEEIIDEHLKELKELPQEYQGLPRWYNQPHYKEIWTEKNAMVPDFQSIINEEELEVRIVPHGGYVSLSQLNDSAQRIFRMVRERGIKHVHILYFGDYDPSGDQMFEDIKDRLARIWGLRSGYTTEFTSVIDHKDYWFKFDITRIAVTKNQVDTYRLPKDPTSPKELKKLEDDTRYDKFLEKNNYVMYAVELDALPVKEAEVFKNLVVDNVNQYFDEDIYNRELEAHKDEHSAETIAKFVKRKTAKFLEDFDKNR